ncbi:1-deoxy-D-xylulose-5-phosphate reductoisomerase [Fundidesulfovibrio agrisoli]|uniref:1-deoxy-D-xylulose-5-phosphate reductoisomerase n=1 Tax=Fundidesulfovibrio agrisoli TaxID=2922717 RepID=UPI001FABCD2D|nr:1-deoxy-D-xylulose-5-phosphate reductoisomerase [Fundidesulfovibrio agrisoli]
MIDYISSLPGAEALPGFPRRLAVLGSTGSIGESALAVAADHPEEISVLALAGGRNVERLAAQAARFRPRYLAMLEEAGAWKLRSMLPAGYAPEILSGPEAYVTLATLEDADVVLSAIVGAAGLPPTLAAAEAGKVVALANKESLVLAGHLIRRACRESGAVILPVDSEHNALFQSLAGHDGQDVDHLVLTASGGPFRDWPAADIPKATAAQALKHPNWSMGAKISIDSATLMNKGLEVIEACQLYGLPQERVKVLVHPQSIVHSLAAYRDGSLLAQMGQPDMRIAIAYCLCYPRRLPLRLEPLDLAALGTLSFSHPRTKDFPCLELARHAAAAGPGHCVTLNAANEVAVELFLKDSIGFPDIARAVSWALDRHPGLDDPDFMTILEVDRATRSAVAAYLTGTS